MKKSFFAQHKKSLFFPIIFLCIILFTLYTVIDTAIVYDSIPLWAVILSVVLALAAIFCIARFSFIHYEYLFVSGELVIRRYTLNQVTLIASLPAENIRSVVKPHRAPLRARHARPYNLCNTVYGTLFSSAVMTYLDAESATYCKVLIDPPAEVRSLLKLTLEKKYRV